MPLLFFIAKIYLLLTLCQGFKYFIQINSFDIYNSNIDELLLSHFIEKEMEAQKEKISNLVKVTQFVRQRQNLTLAF